MNKRYNGAVCRHCCLRKVSRPRGLCWDCFYNPAVRALYPSKVKATPLTEADLEASIASQIGTMPKANGRVEAPSLAAIFKRAR